MSRLIQRPPVLVMSALLLCFSGASLFVASTRSNPMLSLSITCDKLEYKLGDKIACEARLTNQGKEALSLYGRLMWGYAGGLTLHIVDRDRKEVSPKYLDDDKISPNTLKEWSSFVVLAPGHFLGTTRADKVSDLFPEAGEYFVHIEYRSPVPAKFGMGPNFWSFEREAVSSNELRLSIRD